MSMVRTFILIITILSLNGFFNCVLAKTKFYKYYDENGNVHYTDEKPIADEKDGNYTTLDIVGGKIKESTDTETKEKIFSYDEFAISSPLDGSVIKTNNDTVSVSVNLAGSLPKNYRVRFYLDDLPHGKVKSGKQLIADVATGKHKLYATLLEVRSMKVLKTSKTIEFTLEKQP